MIITDEIKSFQKRLNDLCHHLKIEDKIKFIRTEELKTQKNDFWQNQRSW